MNANIEDEKLFLEEVKKGNLIVTETGKITNVKTGHTFKSKEGQYKQITFRINGEKKYILAHRLVWIAHNGLIDDPTIQINHKLGTIAGHGLSNLEPLSPSENVQHAYATGLKKASQGENHWRSKLNSADVLAIRTNFPSSDLTLTEYAANYSVSISTMYALLVCDTWKNIVSGYEEQCKQKLLSNRKTLNQTRCSQSGRFISNSATERR